MNSLKLDVLNKDYEGNMKEIQRMHPGTVRPPLIACDYRTSARQWKREKGDRMKISFPSEKQTIKTFVANLHRCKGWNSKRSQSHFKDALSIASTIDSKKCRHKAEAYHWQWWRRGCQQVILPQYICLQLLQIEEFCKDWANHFRGCCFTAAGVKLLSQVRDIAQQYNCIVLAYNKPF